MYTEKSPAVALAGRPLRGELRRDRKTESSLVLRGSWSRAREQEVGVWRASDLGSKGSRVRGHACRPARGRCAAAHGSSCPSVGGPGCPPLTPLQHLSPPTP